MHKQLKIHVKCTVSNSDCRCGLEKGFASHQTMRDFRLSLHLSTQSSYWISTVVGDITACASCHNKGLGWVIAAAQVSKYSKGEGARACNSSEFWEGK